MGVVAAPAFDKRLWLAASRAVDAAIENQVAFLPGSVGCALGIYPPAVGTVDKGLLQTLTRGDKIRVDRWRAKTAILYTDRVVVSQISAQSKGLRGIVKKIAAAAYCRSGRIEATRARRIDDDVRGLGSVVASQAGCGD